MNFKQMKVGKRLGVAFGAVMALMLLTVALSLYSLSALEDAMEDIYLVNNAKIRYNQDMSEAVHIVARVTRSILLLQDKNEEDREHIKIAQARESYDKAWAALQKFKPSEKGQEIRNKIETARNLTRPLNDKVLALDAEGKTAEAIALLLKEANPAATQWQAALEENIEFQEAKNAEDFAHAQAQYGRAKNILLGVSGLSLLLAVVLGWRVTRSITEQLGTEPTIAAELAQGVAQGDLSLRIDTRVGDTHSLIAHMKAMQTSLVHVVASVRQGSESVATASAQIASGNHDLSARTESQASALEETAASMEELSAQVKQNADSARQANQLAMSASTVAVKGGEVVGQVVETMKGINESSRKIADIISVIDGIAFQTNILALNAAVEAARAGEQGRGFAVVASEVRSLAGRSADAAKEIKKLISVSVERVEHGTSLVDEAGVTMAELVGSIKRVTDIMGEISASSREQALGVAQVGEAVTQMDQATQQNAALVEEMAAAASSLKAQAQDLVQVVAVFKLGSQLDQAPRQARAAMQVSHTSAPSGGHASAKKAGPFKPASGRLPAPKPATKPVSKPESAPSAGNDEWETF